MARHPSTGNQRFVVVPSFDQAEETTRCVEALLSDGTGHFAVLVVDHGYNDWIPPASVPRSQIEVLRAGTDLWWTGATNAGIRHALDSGARSVMLLNADCVLDSTTAVGLFESAETLNQVVAPVQRSIATKTITSAGALPLLAFGFPTLWERTDTARPHRRWMIIRGGRGVVVPAAVFDQVGLLAEDQLPHYLADHDFYLRCRKEGISMDVMDDSNVLVDDTSTTMADRPAELTWRQFRQSLHDPRSHRNLEAIRAFFQRNYPIRRLYFIGTALYLMRYAVSWGTRRAIHKLRYRPAGI